MSTLAENKSFMFTGKLSTTREAARQLVVEAGGLIASSLTRNTDYLVVGDKPGSKLQKGQDYGTSIVDEEEFRQLLVAKDLPTEEWSKNDIKVIPVDVFERVLIELGRREKEKRKEAEEKRSKAAKAARRQVYSFESPYILSLLLKEHPLLIEALNWSTAICRLCGEAVPYYLSHPYCFRCHCYTNCISHRCEYIDHPRLVELDHGKYKICSKCENVKFFKNDEFCRYVETTRDTDISYSAEYYVDIVERTAILKNTAKRSSDRILSQYTDERYNDEFKKWLIREQKRLSRKAAKKPARD